MQAGLFDEAADAAASHITALLRDPNHTSRDWGDALIDLGDAQRAAEDYESAIRNYELAMDKLLEGTDRLDVLFIEPMQGAAEAMIAMRQFGRAAEMLENVVHLRHVNYGPNDLDQSESLDTLSDIYLLLGDHENALARQYSRLNVYDQNYPGDDLRKLPALYDVAELLAETGGMVDSHASYRRIISMIERADGGRSPALLPAFYRISELLANNAIKDGYDGTYKARRYLRRAVYIADHSDAVTTLQRADAHIAMGDFLALYTLDRAAASRRYSKAWRILSADEELRPELDRRFATPRLLNEIPRGTSPLMRQLMNSLKYDQPQPGARVLVRFDIRATGLPHNIEVIDGDPTGYWDSLVVDHVSKFVFRPSLEDGVAIAHENMQWVTPYPMRDEELPD